MFFFTFSILKKISYAEFKQENSKIIIFKYISVRLLLTW